MVGGLCRVDALFFPRITRPCGCRGRKVPSAIGSESQDIQTDSRILSLHPRLMYLPTSPLLSLNPMQNDTALAALHSTHPCHIALSPISPNNVDHTGAAPESGWPQVCARWKTETHPPRHGPLPKRSKDFGPPLGPSDPHTGLGLRPPNPRGVDCYFRRRTPPPCYSDHQALYSSPCPVSL